MTIQRFLSPRKWRRLGWAGFPLLVEVVGSYYFFRTLEDEPLPESLERLSRARPKKRTDPKELVRVVDWFLQPIHGASRCRPRAAVLFRMLSRRDFDPVVVFGVSRKSKELDGHAWVLLDQEPLGEWEDPREKFVETYRYPGNGEWRRESGE